MNLLKKLFIIFLILPSLLGYAQVEEINPDILQKIAIGSCSRESNPDQLWKEIKKDKADLFIWTGDIIYGDTHDMNELAKKYQIQKSRKTYQSMLKKVPVIGIWDDHDYGINDGGKGFSKKTESKAELMKFLDVPKDNPVWSHEGAYNAYTFGKENKKVKIILLDARYFRDTVMRQAEPRKYIPNTEGDILGEAQWLWLENELSDSDADLHILASGIQVIAEDHIYEKWSNLPKARKRLLDLLERTKPKNAFIISGDRHISEISKLELTGLKYPLFDFTSSGLTHTWSNSGEEYNRHRVGDLVIQKSYGLIQIDWASGGPKVTFEMKGKKRESFFSYSYQY
ncbi:MAG: alkaline phosphatase D family protein [Bacteroidota bacterium]